MKKVLLVSIVFVLCIVLVGCGKKEEEKPNDNKEIVLGGWNINTKVTALNIPQKAKYVYERANVDSSLTPIALLGTQVVAGSNYMYLCKDDNGYKVLVIYEDLQGNCSVSKTSDFDVTKYANKNISNETEMLSGGWTINVDMTGDNIDPEVLDAFKVANETITGVEYTPLVVLADQIVSGTNYAILCIGKPSTVGDTKYLDVLTIYKDLNGNSKVSTIANIDLSEFNN